MAEAADEKMRRKYRILIVPLDWGLGHATRCIPVIREFLANGCEVWLAGEGLQEALLRDEFPHLGFLHLAGYRVRYPRRGSLFPLKMLAQSLRIFSAIRSEHRWLRKMLSAHSFDAVISDNRFGLYHKNLPSIFITHQLNIRSSLGQWADGILRHFNYRFINRFNECWVPDFPEEENLGGELSHPLIQPKIPLEYLGLLSRMESTNKEPIPGHLLFVLSGPEPQRTMLENRIVDEVSHYPGTATVVRGLPSSFPIIPSTNMIKFYNHLSATDLNVEMEKAQWIIGRSGYSTVMDIIKLKRKSILIPTPGQTEQEYLAKYLMQKQLAFWVEQNRFSLNVCLDTAEKFNYRVFDARQANHLGEVIKQLLQTLSGDKK